MVDVVIRMRNITHLVTADKIERFGKIGPLIYKSLPPRPYVAERKGSTYRETKRNAILKDYPYIQLNPSNRCSVLVFDCDTDIGMLDWSQIPSPNLIIRHKDADKSYKTHLFYVLENGVPLSDMQTEKQETLFYIVKKALTTMLKADTSYSGLLAKNPFSYSWIAVTCNNEPYTLKELRQWIDDDTANDILDSKRIENNAQFREAFAVAGRNCNVFEHLRLWAYANIHLYHDRGEESFHAACYEHACMINDFASPLPTNEIKNISKSVARWTWKHLTSGKSKEHRKQMSELGRKRGLETRKARHNANRDKFKAMYHPEEGVTIKDVCRSLGIAERTGKMLLKEIKEESAQQMVKDFS